MRASTAMAIVLSALLGAGPAVAQSTAPAPEAAPGDPAARNATLSDKLNAGNGVIRPKGDVDPGMQKRAPATEPMPVVPPPGGASGVQPK